MARTNGSPNSNRHINRQVIQMNLFNFTFLQTKTATRTPIQNQAIIGFYSTTINLEILLMKDHQNIGNQDVKIIHFVKIQRY